MFRGFTDINNPSTGEVLYKFGFNSDVGSAAEETVWDHGGLYSYLGAATTLQISSSSTDDTGAGSGLQTVTVYGLDGDYNEINETVTLTGQTQAPTANQYLRVFRMVGETAGAGAKNAGDIYAGTGTATLGVPANVYARISPGFNQTLMALWTVPANKWFYLESGMATTASANAARTCDVRFYARPENKIFQLKNRIVLRQNSLVTGQPLLVFPPKTDLEVRAIGSAEVDVSAAFSGFVLNGASTTS